MGIHFDWGRKTAAAVVFLALLALMLCSKSPTESDDPPETDLQTVTANMLSLGSADSLYLAVLQTDGREAATAATISYMRSLETVVETGSLSDGSVYAFFTSGLLGAVYNPDLGIKSAGINKVYRPLAPTGGGEVTANATVLLPFAHEFGDASEREVIRLISTTYGSASWLTETYRDGQVTVERIRQTLASSPGILFWSGHGVMLPVTPGSADTTVGLVAGKVYTAAEAADIVNNTYPAEALSGNRQLAVIASGAVHYLCVLPAFVSSHANFDKLEGMANLNATKSLVYICCCSSGQPDMASAFLASGAEAYFGWSKEVSVGFAADTHQKFFGELTDTCTVSEAHALASTRTDPDGGAWLKSFYGDRNVMLRAQVKMNRDGEDFRGQTVTVVEGDATIIAGVTDLDDISKACSFDIEFPSSGPGTYDCVSGDNTVLAVIKMASAKVYYAQKGVTGVSGQITVKQNSSDFLTGRFSGTLGYWAPGQDPSTDPPTETMRIENGFFKHSGVRY